MKSHQKRFRRTFWKQIKLLVIWSLQARKLMSSSSKMVSTFLNLMVLVVMTWEGKAKIFFQDQRTNSSLLKSKKSSLQLQPKQTLKPMQLSFRKLAPVIQLILQFSRPLKGSLVTIFLLRLEILANLLMLTMKVLLSSKKVLYSLTTLHHPMLQSTPYNTRK